MTYYIFRAGDHAMIGADTPLIKANERDEFMSAIDLLEALTTLRTQAEAEAKTRIETAYQEGMAQGYAEAQAQVAKQIEDMAARFEAICEERRADVADAALAATKAIIGALDDVDVTKRLVNQALARIDNGSALTIEVAPTMRDQIAEYVAHLSHVRVEAVEGLGALDCIFQTRSGRILAGLDVQMAALGDRWGVAPADSEAALA
jgi:flagellar biosynthesis/type III secretory pathway protein FliH